jgi:hypothetical protein
MHAECSPARPRLPLHLALRLDIVTIGTPSVVSRSTGLPRPPNPRALSCLIAPRSFAHRSRLGAAASCVSTLVRRAPRPAPCRRLALRLLVRHDARCVRPTSAYSRSSYEHPRLVGSRCVMRLRACAIEEIACFTSVRFASVGHTFVVLSPRWALSSRRDACDPYLWHLCRLSHPVSARSRDLRTRGSRRDRPRPDRVNVRAGRAIRDAFHRARTFAPQRPFERPALEFPGFAAWPPRLRFSTPFHPPRALADSRRAGSPSTRPVANGRHASLDLGVACRFLQPETTRGHTQRAFNPRTRVELSPRCSPAPTDAGCVGPRYVAASGACEPRTARAGLRTTCSTCVDRADRGPKRSSKGEPRALGRCRACPSRCASGTRVAGSIGDEAWRTSSLVAPA